MQQGVTAKQRSANEMHFFTSSPWKEQNLDSSRVGIDKLRDSLQSLLDQHIESELPKVREEIRAMIRSSENEIAGLRSERPTLAHLRMYLCQLAMEYHKITTAALHGDYHTGYADFFSAPGGRVPPSRLRALVHVANTDFADTLRHSGKTIIVDPSRAKPVQSGEKLLFEDECGVDPVYVDEKRFKAWVKKVWTQMFSMISTCD